MGFGEMSWWIRNTKNSFRRPRFDSQHVPNSSQLSETLTPSSNLPGHLACRWYTDILSCKAFIHIK